MHIKEKLRILQVIPSLRKGGAERLVLDISHQLVSLGHEVLIIIFDQNNEYPVVSNGLNIEVVPSQVNYSISGKNLINTEKYIKRAAAFNPHIIHSHLLESEFVTRHTPMPSVLYLTHWHGCHLPTNPRTLIDHFKKDTWWNINSIRQLKKGYQACDNQFLCISDFIRGYVKRAIGPKDDHMHVILNGTDLNNFKYRPVEKNTDNFRLISIGGFHKYKNQVFLLKVMKKLSETGYDNITLQLLGDGAERDNLKAYVSENKLSQTVEFLGYVNNPDEYLNKANVMVHAAIDEPFGLILLEAMSCKIPVVAFRSGGIPEIVLNERTGLLTEVNDIDGFVKSILRLRDNPEMVQSFGEQGQIAVQEFEITKYVKQIENLYFELLKQRQN